jgi:PAS domain-containing protein
VHADYNHREEKKQMSFNTILDLILRSNFSSDSSDEGLQSDKLQFIDYMINHISNLIFVADRNNRFVYVNDSVVRKYNYTRG